MGVRWLGENDCRKSLNQLTSCWKRTWCRDAVNVEKSRMMCFGSVELNQRLGELGNDEHFDSGYRQAITALNEYIHLLKTRTTVWEPCDDHYTSTRHLEA
jgi:hypothetical protein